MESSSAPPPLPVTGDAQPPPASCWSSVLQKKPVPKPQEPMPSNAFVDCKSSKGISVAVVDANAIIHGDKLVGCADKFVSVSEVLEEVRDPVSRHRLAFLPFVVETMEPSPESIKKVVKFARETGDLQTLSDVDLKLIALTYMLEEQIHGAGHLRNSPPPLQVVNVKKLPEAEMPGWGSNVPNLVEWEALEQATEGGGNDGSRILPLKDLDENVIHKTETDTQPGELDGEDQALLRPRRFSAPKKEIKLDGKKMVAAGIDASQGENTDNADDWLPAVSRSTHRRYLRRKARREMSTPSEENDGKTASDLAEGSLDCDVVECKSSLEATREIEHFKIDELIEESSQNHNIFSVHELEKSSLLDSEPLKEDDVPEIASGDAGYARGVAGEDEVCLLTSELKNIEIYENSIGTSMVDDDGSEQSWMLRSLSDSTVACITSDFAMQNVILQIGLRLLAPGGMQIRQLNRWVLRCHACNNVTQEIGRIFCPKCGNGGTLRKVSVTVGENGIVLAARRQRITLRGTKFSLPMPQGGREAITKNLILREDQLPRKMLYPKTKKKSSKDDFLSTDDIFSHSGEKRAPLKPPVRKALALFSGKRNPNDNHFSRLKC